MECGGPPLPDFAALHPGYVDPYSTLRPSFLISAAHLASS